VTRVVDISSLEIHPVVGILPPASEEDFNALLEDIRRHGQIEPVTVQGARIVDGRNRYEACKRLGLREIKVREWAGGGPLAEYVVSVNVHRRHLTAGQKAAVAAGLLPELERDAGERRKVHGMTAPGRPRNTSGKNSGSVAGEARDHAARVVGVNPRYVSDFKRLQAESPELAEKVRLGEVGLPRAVREQRRKAAFAADRERLVKEAQGSKQRAKLRRMPALEFLRGIPEGGVELLLTDPPYSTDVDDVDSFAREWVPAAISKVKPTGRAYIFTGAYPAELAAYLGVMLSQDRLALANVLVWTYRNTLGPKPKAAYKLNWQAIFHLVGPDAPGLECPRMVEQFSVQDVNAPDGRLGNRYHAWQKPDELAERLVRHSTRPGDSVIDPFAGTGTFLLAAARLGRSASGCEIDPGMIEIAVERGCLVEG